MGEKSKRNSERPELAESRHVRLTPYDRGCVETEILRNWSRCVCDAATELGLDRGKWNAISLLSAFIPLSSPL